MMIRLIVSVFLGISTLFPLALGLPNPYVVNDGQLSENAIQQQFDVFEKNLVEQKKEGKSVDARCELCKFTLLQLDKFLKENKTADAINSTLYRICNSLPTTYKLLCLPAIPAIEESIEQGLAPESTCIKAGLCRNKTNELLNLAKTLTPTDKSLTTRNPGLIKVSLQSQTNQGSVIKNQVNNVLDQSNDIGQDKTGLHKNAQYSVIQESSGPDGNKTFKETNELPAETVSNSNAGLVKQPYQQSTPLRTGEQSNQLPQQGTSLNQETQNNELQQQSNVQQTYQQGTPLNQETQNNELRQQSNVQQTYQQGMPLNQGAQNSLLKQNSAQQQNNLPQPTSRIKDEFSTPKLSMFSTDVPRRSSSYKPAAFKSYSTPTQKLDQTKVATNQQGYNDLKKAQYTGRPYGTIPKSADGAQFGLMPGPVLLQPSQVGTDKNSLTDTLRNKYKTGKSTEAVWKSFHLPKSSSYRTSKTTLVQMNNKISTSTQNAMNMDKEDEFLDVNTGETEDDDWYHVDDDEYADGKDGNDKGKDQTDDDWNFWQEDDTKFKDNIDIDGGKTNADQSNTDIDWDPSYNNAEWSFKNSYTNRLPVNKKPYIKELTVELNKNKEDNLYERLNMISFYSWIIFISFVMISCFIFIRHRYRFGSTYHGSNHNGSKSYTWKTSAEEGKSLMKNVYT